MRQQPVSDNELIAFAAELNEDVPTVDLHGMSRHEACYALDQAVNHAFMQGSETLRIIHGRGSGALRATVHQHLRAFHGLVAFFRDAQGAGQVGGVTIAVLHRKT